MHARVCVCVCSINIPMWSLQTYLFAERCYLVVYADPDVDFGLEEDDGDQGVILPTVLHMSPYTDADYTHAIQPITPISCKPQAQQSPSQDTVGVLPLLGGYFFNYFRNSQIM